MTIDKVLTPYAGEYYTGHTGQEIHIQDNGNSPNTVRLVFLDVLCSILKLRYKESGEEIKDAKGQMLYYRIINDSVAPYIEIKDKYGMKDVNFSSFTATKIADKHRMVLDMRSLDSIGLSLGTPVVCVGMGDHIRIYSQETYKKIKS